MTELIWEGKYKDDKKIAPVRISLPFQTIETVNESATNRSRNLDLFASGRIHCRICLLSGHLHNN